MNPSSLIVERHGAVSLITLNAPKTRNALTPEMLCRLADAVMQLQADDGLRVAVITGCGEQAFCAGGDLASTLPLLTGARAPEDEWDRRLLADPAVMHAASLRGWPLHKPVIAAINGACMAGGFELMLGTDIRVAADHARFALPEVKRGVIPFAGSMARLPRQIPHCVAMEILLTGDALDAREAHRLGLVNRVVPGEDVLPVAMAMAETIAANAPLAVQAVKRTAQACSGVPLAAAYPIEDEAWEAVKASDDAREGPRAFMQKRAPVYRGR